MKIKNRDQLISRGDSHGKEILLNIADKTLQELDGYKRIKSIMERKGDILYIGKKSWDLKNKDNIYLFAAGKAANAMALAVDETLGDRLTKGIAIVKIKEDCDIYHHTDIYVGGHPLPNEEGQRACLEMLKIVEGASEKDLFIIAVSGGSSALMGCPAEGITLEDEIKATDVMLKSGANVLEINAVRRHISRINGGMLAKGIYDKGAKLIGFSIFDAIGWPATGDIGIPYENFSGGPMGPDNTTLEEARQVLIDYDIRDKVPASVRNYLDNCGADKETPKQLPGNTYFVLNTLPDSCIYAKRIAKEMGISAHILTSFLEGEAKDVGIMMASLAKEIQSFGNPVKPPCVLISAGEAVTTIRDNKEIKGHGGPSQELTASFAIHAQTVPGACMLSMDSEGTDGTTKAAGGLTDSQTFKRALDRGISLHEALRTHAAYEALDPLDAVVFTGNTGTNLCDFNLLYVPEKKSEAGRCVNDAE